jgi:hypothetical protein
MELICCKSIDNLFRWAAKWHKNFTLIVGMPSIYRDKPNLHLIRVGLLQCDLWAHEINALAEKDLNVGS